MERFNNFVSSIDWEYEAQRDFIYELERQKDLEATWQQEEENKRKPTIIKVEKLKTVYEATSDTWEFPRTNQTKL